MCEYAKLLIYMMKIMKFVRFTAFSRRAVLNLGNVIIHCTICTIWLLLEFSEMWAINVCYTCGMVSKHMSSDSTTGPGRMGRSAHASGLSAVAAICNLRQRFIDWKILGKVSKSRSGGA